MLLFHDTLYPVISRDGHSGCGGSPTRRLLSLLHPIAHLAMRRPFAGSEIQSEDSTGRYLMLRYRIAFDQHFILFLAALFNL